jgi:hypothetical protein
MDKIRIRPFKERTRKTIFLFEMPDDQYSYSELKPYQTLKYKDGLTKAQVVEVLQKITDDNPDKHLFFSLRVNAPKWRLYKSSENDDKELFSNID